MGQGDEVQAKVAALVEWCQNQGARIDPRLSFEYSFDKGISTLYRPSEDELNQSNPLHICVGIPKNMILDSNSAKSWFEREIPGFHTGLSSSVLFKAYLAYMLTEDESKQSAYVKLLPKADEIRSPLTYNEDEMNLLRDTNLYQGTQVKLSQLKTEYGVLIYDIGDSLRKISFHDFLWGHLILSSRAFPYKLVDKTADPSSVMMLPLLDFMNHKPMSKVTWNFDGSQFKVDVVVDNPSREIEVCNNYGPKGNEELLMGYGFVLPDNEFNCLQLSLPSEALQPALKDVKLSDWNITKLPHLDDYTYSVVENEMPKNLMPPDEQNNKYVVFLCNRSHPIPDGLLELFSLASKNEEDTQLTLKCELNGINKLRASLNDKFQGKLSNMPARTDNVRQVNYDNCRIYREGQLQVYNLVKKALKSKEKELLKTYRKSLITVRDIIKKDSEFEPFLGIYGSWDKESSNSSQFEIDRLIHLWLMKIVNYDDSDGLKMDVSWIIDAFNHLKGKKYRVDPYAYTLYQMRVGVLIKETGNLLTKGQHWDIQSFMMVHEIYVNNSYEKGSSLEPILIKPTLL